MSEMSKTDDKIERSTQILLATLDREIDMKCYELIEKKKQYQHKKVFFLSCIAVVIIFLIQVFFNMFNFNIIFTIIFYQALAILIITLIIPNILVGGDI